MGFTLSHTPGEYEATGVFLGSKVLDPRAAHGIRIELNRITVIVIFQTAMPMYSGDSGIVEQTNAIGQFLAPTSTRVWNAILKNCSLSQSTTKPTDWQAFTRLGIGVGLLGGHCVPQARAIWTSVLGLRVGRMVAHWVSLVWMASQMGWAERRG